MTEGVEMRNMRDTKILNSQSVMKTVHKIRVSMTLLTISKSLVNIGNTM